MRSCACICMLSASAHWVRQHAAGKNSQSDLSDSTILAKNIVHLFWWNLKRKIPVSTQNKWHNNDILPFQGGNETTKILTNKNNTFLPSTESTWYRNYTAQQCPIWHFLRVVTTSTCPPPLFPFFLPSRLWHITRDKMDQTFLLHLVYCRQLKTGQWKGLGTRQQEPSTLYME